MRTACRSALEVRAAVLMQSEMAWASCALCCSSKRRPAAHTARRCNAQAANTHLLVGSSKRYYGDFENLRAKSGQWACRGSVRTTAGGLAAMIDRRTQKLLQSNSAPHTCKYMLAVCRPAPLPSMRPARITLACCAAARSRPLTQQQKRLGCELPFLRSGLCNIMLGLQCSRAVQLISFCILL